MNMKVVFWLVGLGFLDFLGMLKFLLKNKQTSFFGKFLSYVFNPHFTTYRYLQNPQVIEHVSLCNSELTCARNMNPKP